MVKEALVGLDVESGNRVLDLLDAAKFPVPVALWIRRGDEGRWGLLLASPLYDKLGPGAAYRKLVDTLWTSDQDWVHSPIHLESTRNPLIRELRQIFKRFPDSAAKRIGGRMIGDVWVDEAYIYRVQ
jgi:hypothetical protein